MGYVVWALVVVTVMVDEEGRGGKEGFETRSDRWGMRCLLYLGIALHYSPD